MNLRSSIHLLALIFFSAKSFAYTVTDSDITENTTVLDSAIINPHDNRQYTTFTPSVPSKEGGITLASPGGDDPADDTLGPASEDIFARLNTNFTLNPHTTDLLGDSIDLNNGNVKFNQSDLVISGNGVGLDIVISRTLRDSSYSTFSQANMGDWTLDIPAIQTTLLRNRTRYSGAWGIGKECSGDIDPGPISNWGNNYEQYEYWNGDHLQLPNGKNEKLLQNHSGALVGTTYKRVTKSNWKFSCFNRSSGGEGFTGYAPNGLKYTFDKYRLVQSKPLFKGSKPTGRHHAFMMVSKIEDRFGNYINYNYTGSKLTSITSSDSRSVSFTYGTGSEANFIRTMNYNGKTWTYTYSGNSLTQVKRPDNKSWVYDLDEYASFNSPSIESGLCVFRSGYTIRDIVGTVKHPDGVLGTFTYSPQIHGRSNVSKMYRGIGPSSGYIQDKCYANFALKSKVLTGPRLSTMQWSYDYSSNAGTWSNETPTSWHKLSDTSPSNVDAENYKSTLVTSPNGAIKYFYNRDFTSYLEGSLVAIKNFDTNGSTLLSQTELTFSASSAVGDSGVMLDNTNHTNKRVLKTKKTIKSNNLANTYTTIYSAFDKYGHSVLTSESNSFNGKKRYTKQFVYNDTTNWLIGRPSYQQVSSNASTYKETSRTTYHSATGAYKSHPYEHRSFGRWYKRNDSYHTSGMSKGLPNKVSYNGTNRWVYYSNYKRGIAQTIRTPKSLSTSSQYAYNVVNNDGNVTKQTDFLGACINYSYDNLGRMTLVDPCDTRWTSTTVDYSTTSGSEGLSYVSSGMLKQTITKGNYQKATYLDGLLRPIITKEWDKTKTATTRYTRNAYDAFNRATFTSFPSSSSTTSYGVSTQYDGIGRTKNVDDNTTTGSVSYNYLTNNRVQVNDNKGHVTTTTYLAYGAPHQSMATSISAPTSTTSIAYNIYGNTTAITQGGLTESRVYDNYQQLCKTVRPDVGNTAIVKDALGQITWQAKGSSVNSSATVCDTSVTASDKASFTYDNLGNIKSVSFDDVSPDKTYVYDANSRLKTLTAGAVTTSFEYNSENVIEKETLTIDGQSFILDYVYNSNGLLTNTIYPSGANITHSPNALGQETRVGSYATNATYFPNGTIKTHQYNNGFAHTSTQYNNGLPKNFYDRKSSTYAINHTLSYDANNNVTILDDKVNSAYDLSLTYDGLDRLDKINDSYLGAGDVNYDSMGNISYYKLGSNAITYHYNTNKQLDSTSGSKAYDFSYDDKGNVSDNGLRGFTYNTANQMIESGGYVYTYDGSNKRVKEVTSHGTDYSFYGSNGKLMYRQVGGQHVDYYYLNSKLVANKKGSTVTYLHADYLGSTAAESNGAGTVMSRLHYQPFGESIEPPKDDVGYTGHKFDTDLGLSYMQARYYDPVIGRFYSNDPVGFIGNPHSFNRYAYANNNPYKYTDPDGELPQMVVGAFLGAITDIAIQSVQIARGKQSEFSGASVFASAASGAIGVGLAGKLNVLGGMAVDAGLSMGSSVIKGEEITATGVVADVAGGLTGGLAGDAIKSTVKTSKVATKQASRLNRIANKPGARAAQVNRAANATANLSADQGIAAVRAAVVSSGVSTQVLKENYE